MSGPVSARAGGMAGIAPSWSQALTGFAVLAVLLVAGQADVVAQMATTWWTTTTYNHGFLILPVSLWLVWTRRAELAAIEPRPAPLALLALAGLGLLALLGRAGDVLLVQEVALIGALVALVVLALGWRVGRLLAFPLGFLFFMVPFGDFLIAPLQDFTAAFAVWLLRAAGVPVYQEGIFIQLPNGLFEVAEACAGLRFLIANLVVATLFAHLAYRYWWKKAIMIGLGLAIPVIANGFRAFGIMYLAYATDNRLAADADHLIYGWGFFTVVMLLMLLIGRSFADRHIGRGEPVAEAKPAGSGAAAPAGIVPARRPPLGLLLAAALVLVAVPAYGHLVMAPPADIAVAAEPARPITDAWPRRPSGPSDWAPDFVGPDRLVLESYGVDGTRVAFFVAYYAYQRQGAEAVYFANDLAGSAWRSIGGGTAATPAGPAAQAGQVVLSRVDRQRLVLSWYWVDGKFTHDPLRAKLWQALARLLGRSQAAAVVAVSAEYEDRPAEAMEALQVFLADLDDLPGYLRAFGG